MTSIDLDAIAAERERIRQDLPAGRVRDGRTSSARGLHHFALICSDVRRTIEFYQGVLEFPLTEIFENRDYAGSNHFFFDIGNGNLLAFFDLPGLDLGPYAEVLGGLHHIAISVTREKWEHLRGKLDAAGVEYMVESEVVDLLPRPRRRAPRAARRPAGGDVRHQGAVSRCRSTRDRRSAARMAARHTPASDDDRCCQSDWSQAPTKQVSGGTVDGSRVRRKWHSVRSRVALRG